MTGRSQHRPSTPSQLRSARSALSGCVAVLLLGATSLGSTACRSDFGDTSGHGFAATAVRASRAPAHVVGAPDNTNEVDAGLDHVTRKGLGDAGLAPALPLKDRESLASDALAARDSAGLLLDAEWRWNDTPGAANAPETSVEALDSLRNATRMRMRIELVSAGRMRLIFIGQGYPWADGTELRARTDRLGHVLVWPDGKHHRNVVVGALRALFTDRRLDRGSLFTPRIAAGASGSLLGQATSKRNFTTPVGEVQLESASVAAVGSGGLLLCRMLVELIGADPDTAQCNADQLILRANISSAPGGRLQFIVNHVSKKLDLPLAGIQVPPENSNFETSGLPLPPGTVSRQQLAALRLHPVPTGTPGRDAPAQGLVAANRTHTLRALLVDGVVVSWLMPHSELAIPELKNGTYTLAWRDFFGTTAEPAKTLALPARLDLGDAPEPAASP